MIDNSSVMTDDPTSNEHVANMLPIVGLNGQTISRSIDTKDELNIFDDTVDTIEDDDVLKLNESVINYIMNEDAVLDFDVQEGVNETAKEAETEVPLSEEIKKTVVMISVLKAKVKVLKSIKTDEDYSKKIIEAKREAVALTKKLNNLMKGATREQKKAVKKLSAESFKSAIIDVRAEFNKEDKPKEDKKEEKEVKESVEDIITEDTDDKVELPPELKRIDIKRGKLANLERDLDSAQNRLMSSGEKMYENKIKGLTYKIEKLKKEIEIEEKLAKAITNESALTTEAANMEDEIKPIVEKLNAKGYKVKYASPGHRNLRKKEDKEPDGVYYDNLYSDARIMFKDLYKFPDAPKYWHWRVVDGCSYLDISPKKYDKKDGTPDEAFAKWKENYMYNLREYVDKLESKVERTEESVDEFIESMMDDIYSRIGFDELEVYESTTDNKDYYDKIIDEMDEFLS